MARPQKRQRPDDLSRDRSLLKKTKNHHSSYSPKFWDNLSRQWLTRRAIKEHNRRNNTTEPSDLRAIRGGRCREIPRLLKQAGRGLARFARQGGPNLFDLRVSLNDNTADLRLLTATPLVSIHHEFLLPKPTDAVHEPNELLFEDYCVCR